MNLKNSACILTIAFILSSCQGLKNPESQNIEDPIVHTSMGDLQIADIRFVDEVHDVKPGENEKLMLLILERPGNIALKPEEFSLEEFQRMVHEENSGGIYIRGNDGGRSYTTMAGWIGPNSDEFCIGFIIPQDIKSYQLHWPGNDPVMLHPNDPGAHAGDAAVR